MHAAPAGRREGDAMSEKRDSRIVDLPKRSDPRGNLTFIEGSNHVPFAIRRVFYLYDVPGGETRAGHCNIETEQFIVAMSGSFDVTVDDGTGRKRHHLNRAYCGLYVPTMVWREIDNFSSGAVCLVLASTTYSADDYIRDYAEFLKRVTGAG
jgi:oxalate decarboxylase/phosphoglucose isomerase-like protein (cupin superfamily)